MEAREDSRIRNEASLEKGKYSRKKEDEEEMSGEWNMSGKFENKTSRKKGYLCNGERNFQIKGVWRMGLRCK